MSDLSNAIPIEPFDRGNPARRCTARKKTGEKCRKWAIKGGTVCTHHGGRAPQTKAKARQRIAEAADPMAVLLIKIAMDEKAPYAVRLAAVRDVLDRAGLGAKQAVEVGLELQPWEELMRDVAFDGVARITRAEHEALKARAQYGVLPDVGPPALPTPTPEIVRAEPLPVRKPPVLTPSRYGDDADAPGSIDVADGTSATSTTPVVPPPLLNQDEAAAVMRESRIRSHPVRRGPKRRGR
jgi:hypothetical protein